MRFFIPTLLFLSALLPTPLKAQIVPDNTLGTTLIPNMIINGIESDKIEGGARSANNLFHSFSEFNIDTGRGVYFTNPIDVTNIFTRVTGANASNINGILGVQGNANLFLMNPNGIIFGTGANLDVKGSFIGTTASTINFADGVVFSSRDVINNTNSILTQSVPISTLR